MVTIISGEDIYRLENACQRLYKQQNIDKDHRFVIDASDKKTFSIEEVLRECDSYSLFDDDKKAVIVKNPFFLSSSSKEAEKPKKTDSPVVKKRKENEIKKRDQRIFRLEEYLKNENGNTLLVFLCHGYNADSRKKDYKLIATYAKEILNFPKMDDKDYRNFVGKRLKEENIVVDKSSLNEIVDRTAGDTLLLQQAIKKIDLYGVKTPSLEDIKHLVPINLDVDVFKLTTSFTLADVQGCFDAIEEMLMASYDYNAMIAMLAKRLRTIYNMKLLNEKGYSNEEIATRMHVKSGYVWFVLKDSHRMNAPTILLYLKELANIDQSVKLGEADPKDSFEDFIIRNTQIKQARYYHAT